MEDSLLSLPFDQYQRYQAIAQIANIFRKEKQQLRVLDVGGYPGIISTFLTEDETHIVDIEPSDMANYHQGSGSDLPFDDDEFDMVTAVDTYEHVLQDERSKFLSELFRVSKNFVVVVGPFACEQVEMAEQFIFDFSEKTLGKDFADSHPLKEHISFGLPYLSETVQAFEKAGLKCTTFPSGYLYNWLILNFVKHFLFTIPDSDTLYKSIDYYYNKYFYEIDKKDPAYRTIIVGVVPEKAQYLREVQENYFASPQATDADIAFRLEFFGLLVNLFDLGAKRELNEIKRVNAELDEKLHHSEAAREELTIKLETLSKESEKQQMLLAQKEERLQALTFELDSGKLEYQRSRERLDALEGNRMVRILSKLMGDRTKRGV